jgi:HAD domain in Swiss Army Knife RNA repair proteins
VRRSNVAAQLYRDAKMGFQIDDRCCNLHAQKRLFRGKIQATTPLGEIRCAGEMKVIFLDIDGVLNCNRTPNPRKFPFIVDPILLRRLHRLLELTGAKVVLSSNWRYDPAGMFSARHYGVPFIDTTPDLPGEPRHNPIVEWMRRHSDVERFIVIDDEDDELDALPLFQPLRSTGLTEDIIVAAADYLNGKTDKDMRRSKLVRILQNLSSLIVGHKG